MLRYKFLSVAIVLICIIFSLKIFAVGYDQLQELRSFRDAEDLYENKANTTMNITSSVSVSHGSGEKFHMAKLLIPKIGLECWIRSDTVNAYESVYHYPESVYFGQGGECGLLGHRTTYSAPFGEIYKLEPGDLVIINDFITSKKYTYKVVSNGHIKWDYKENPIRFEQGGEPRLILVTCYREGSSKGAWMTHCSLVSTQSLD